MLSSIVTPRLVRCVPSLLSCRFVLAGLLVFALQAHAAFAGPEATAPVNLISNPGFETGMEPWTIDNWAANDITCERDTRNPHSGAYSMMVRLNKVNRMPNLMFAFPHPALRPGAAVKLSFWARGVSNGATLTVLFRREIPPAYPAMFQAEAGLTDEWQQYTYTTTLPQDMDAARTALRFAIKAVGVFWIDDISVVELPLVEGGPAPTINPIRNPSFEVGTDGWTATMRAREWPKDLAQHETGCPAPSPAGARLDTPVDDRAPQGRRYLSFEMPRESVATDLTSAYFPARYGHEILLTFSIRSDGAHPFQVSVGGGKNQGVSVQSRSMSTSDQWQTLTVSLTLKPVPDGRYFLLFHFNQPARYDLDAVSLVEAGGTKPVLYPESVAIQPEESTPAGHLYAPGQSASFRLVTAAGPTAVKLAHRITVLDFLGRKVDDFVVNLTTDSHGYGEQAFAVPTGRLGAFRIEARLAGSTEVLAEQLYSALPTLPLPAERRDSYFGGHVDLTPYNLEIARRAGFRWLRLYPPMATKWMTVEPHPGEWTFRTEAVAAAKADGFRIMGSFDTAPDFAADIDPHSPVKNRWNRSYPPVDLDAWKDYVTRCFKAFGPYIDAWEVWNEPDGGYLQVRPELKKDRVYLSLLKAAREALDATGEPVVLLGPAVANIDASLGWQVLEQGGGQWMDAFSFHFYGIAAGGDNPDDALALPLLAKYRTYKNRQGEMLPLWVTEAGAYLNGAQSWLATYRIPPSSPVTPPQAAAAMVRAALFFKAMGVKHYFDFQLSASETGRKVQVDDVTGFIDVTGIPGPGIAAHAAMVALTEDTAPLGYEVVADSPARVKIAHFKSAERLIDVYWSGEPVSLQGVAALQSGDEVRDMMNNPVAAKDAMIGQFPLYVLRSVTTK
jgi:hypothetical protein